MSVDNYLFPFALPYNPGFDIQAVVNTSIHLPSHSWEYGAATMALLELYNPQNSVFGAVPFPAPILWSDDSVPAMKFGKEWIVLGGEAPNALSDGAGATGDPASLGVIAWLIGKTDSTYGDAVVDTVDYLVQSAPRWENGAISQRADVAELWADFMYMAPPLLAYYAADTFNATLLYDSYKQIELQREVLINESGHGLWRHIIGPQSQEPGLWATGNGWAIGGMTRILATIQKAPVAQFADWKDQAIADITGWIKEIVDGVMATELEDGMVLNYMDTDGTIEAGRIYPELSGSAMVANVVYRMAVLQPDVFGESYLAFADGIRNTLGKTDSAGHAHVTATGVVTPTVDPLNWFSTEPYTAGSPEGNAFVVMMYAAWRDCINAGKCVYEGEVSYKRSRITRDIVE
ncbi:hypothetical protein CYLTODRAFT_353000 [Cylindrobasidium torrendii FP15055 ss-10]|uniref:Glycoside hydrolase family 105 protein n=1 Tax=Cylindrobasidium torrendii FP15055 ss-10 TaxID=1314674 RepID=A0A0D7BAK9_9AGAR|nr:hypothetical protein CYLTODRAFT_353000 [Cylindrobasidium torrendii FP15055 ss-10]